MPTSAAGNVSLDKFENFPGDFKSAYDAVANRLGTSDDKRIDAEIRREYNAQHIPPDKAAQNLLVENTLGQEEKIDTANLAKELVSMRSKNPDQADRVETKIRATLSSADQSRLTQDLGRLADQAAKANDNLMDLGRYASRHVGRITTVNDLGAYSSRILKDATHVSLPSGGRNGAAPTTGDVLNVRQVVVMLQDTARADPQLAQTLRMELETRMSPQDRADMNRMLAGESSFVEEIIAAGENPGDAIVGGGKGFINSNGDLVDLTVQSGALKAAVDLEERASMQAFFGNKDLADSMFKQAKNMRESAKQEIILNIPHNNMAQQGGQNIQMIAEGAGAGYGIGKNALGGVADVAKAGGKQVDEVGNETNPYGNLIDSPSVGPGKNFTAAQKAKIYSQNIEANGGVLRSDLDGQMLVMPGKSTRGVTPSSNEAQIDHIIAKKPSDPRAPPGTNSFDNAQVLSREQNRAKSNN